MVFTAQIYASHLVEHFDLILMDAASGSALKQVWRTPLFHQNTYERPSDVTNLLTKVHALLTKQMELVGHYVTENAKSMTTGK